MHKLLLTLAALLGPFALAQTPSTPPAAAQSARALTPAQVPEAYARALHFKTPDLERLAALFTPQARFTDLSRTLNGREQIKRFGQEILDAGGVYTTRSVRVSGNTVTWLFDFRAGGYFLKGEGIFKLRDGLIAELDIQPEG